MWLFMLGAITGFSALYILGWAIDARSKRNAHRRQVARAYWTDILIKEGWVQWGGTNWSGEQVR